MSGQAHWDEVYTRRDEAELTWFEAVPELSLKLIADHAPRGASVIDVGGGMSRLADQLLARGYADVAVLDLSSAAIAQARTRLGPEAERVHWIVADVATWRSDLLHDVWHDRAVFHFLTERGAREGYVDALRSALAPGGIAIVATFAEDGPEMCSGLPVVRYSPESLAAEFGRLAPGLLAPVASERHVHLTPLGREQRFQMSVFRRAG